MMTQGLETALNRVALPFMDRHFFSKVIGDAVSDATKRSMATAGAYFTHKSMREAEAGGRKGKGKGALWPMGAVAGGIAAGSIRKVSDDIKPTLLEKTIRYIIPDVVFTHLSTARIPGVTAETVSKVVKGFSTFWHGFKSFIPLSGMKWFQWMGRNFRTNLGLYFSDKIAKRFKVDADKNMWVRPVGFGIMAALWRKQGFRTNSVSTAKDYVSDITAACAAGAAYTCALKHTPGNEGEKNLVANEVTDMIQSAHSYIYMGAVTRQNIHARVDDLVQF